MWDERREKEMRKMMKMDLYPLSSYSLMMLLMMKRKKKKKRKKRQRKKKEREEEEERDEDDLPKIVHFLSLCCLHSLSHH